jgi:solute carrier family 8 (sodium/calcium exchanger)
LKIKKNQLRNISKNLGDNNSLIVEIAQGIQTTSTRTVPESAQKEIRQLYMEILEVDDLT